MNLQAQVEIRLPGVTVCTSYRDFKIKHNQGRWITLNSFIRTVVLQTSFGMRDSHITHETLPRMSSNVVYHPTASPCGEMESRKAMFASMSSGASTAVCVFLCE